jgi:hypothetical protein
VFENGISEKVHEILIIFEIFQSFQTIFVSFTWWWN